jgi:hypothetical protein
MIARLFSRPALKAIPAGIAGGLLAAAGYLLMWALWYTISPEPYSMDEVRAVQEGLFMLLLVPAATAFFALTVDAKAIRTFKDVLAAAVISGIASGVTMLVVAAIGLFRMFFGVVPGPLYSEPMLFRGGTTYDYLITDPLQLFYFSPHGSTLSQLQGTLSVLFDVAVAVVRFSLFPTAMTVLFAFGVFYVWPQLYRIFDDPDKRNAEKMLTTLAIGLAIFALIVFPPLLFQHR